MALTMMTEFGGNFSAGETQLLCISSSTPLLLPGGGSILACEVIPGETQLVGQNGEPVDVLVNEGAYSSTMYRIEYEHGSHTVTPNHLVTLRCGQSPAVQLVPLADSGSYALNLLWWDGATMTRLVRGWRFHTPEFDGNLPTKATECGSAYEFESVEADSPYGQKLLSAGDREAEWVNVNSTLQVTGGNPTRLAMRKKGTAGQGKWLGARPLGARTLIPSRVTPDEARNFAARRSSFSFACWRVRRCARGRVE